MNTTRKLRLGPLTKTGEYQTDLLLPGQSQV